MKIHGFREYLMSEIPWEMGMGSRAGWMEKDAFFFFKSSVLPSGLDEIFGHEALSPFIIKNTPTLNHKNA